MSWFYNHVQGDMGFPSDGIGNCRVYKNEIDNQFWCKDLCFLWVLFYLDRYILGRVWALRLVQVLEPPKIVSMSIMRKGTFCGSQTKHHHKMEAQNYPELNWWFFKIQSSPSIFPKYRKISFAVDKESSCVIRLIEVYICNAIV